MQHYIGFRVGDNDGLRVGLILGDNDGLSVGLIEGAKVGLNDGLKVLLNGKNDKCQK